MNTITPPPTIAPAISGEYKSVHAKMLGSWLVDYLDSTASTITLTGAIRRNQSTVSRLEVLAVTNDPRHLTARLDSLTVAGYAKHARHTGDEWIARISGMPVTVTIANHNNAGLMLWITTGPQEAITHALGYMLPAGVSFDGQYLTDHAQRKIIVKDERILHQILCMPSVAPQHRSLSIYKRASGRQNRRHFPMPEFEFVQDTPPPSQESLF